MSVRDWRRWAALAALGLGGLLAGGGLGACGGGTAETETVTIGEGAASGEGEPRVETVTVEGPSETVTVTKTVTETVTETVRLKPEPKPKPEPRAQSFSGNGGKTLRVRVPRDATFRWTNDGMLFQVFDQDFSWAGINSQAHRGNSYIPSGHYTLIVNAVGNWTIEIR
jgi:hypothetical protein